jgi:hypothetical protein
MLLDVLFHLGKSILKYLYYWGFLRELFIYFLRCLSPLAFHAIIVYLIVPLICNGECTLQYSTFYIFLLFCLFLPHSNKYPSSAVTLNTLVPCSFFYRKNGYTHLMQKAKIEILVTCINWANWNDILFWSEREEAFSYSRENEKKGMIILLCIILYKANIIEKAALNTLWVFYIKRKNIRNYHVTLQGYL